MLLMPKGRRKPFGYLERFRLVGSATRPSVERILGAFPKVLPKLKWRALETLIVG